MHFFKKKQVSTVPPVVVTDTTQQELASRPVSAQSKALAETTVVSVKRNFCQQCCSKENLKEQALLIATVTAVVLGIVVGISLRGLKCPGGKNDVHSISDFHLFILWIVDERVNGCRITKEDISYIEFPGKIFIDILKMLILPLIVSSIISALAQLDAQSSGKMGARALVYYLGTTLIASIIGIILVLSIRPGTRGATVEIKPDAKSTEGRTIDTVLDLFR